MVYAWLWKNGMRLTLQSGYSLNELRHIIIGPKTLLEKDSRTIWIRDGYSAMIQNLQLCVLLILDTDPKEGEKNMLVCKYEAYRTQLTKKATKRAMVDPCNWLRVCSTSDYA